MGKTKWKEANWELALDRYTMGVDMLQNRRARGTENEELLNGMTCRLLRNQAACALKLELSFHSGRTFPSFEKRGCSYFENLFSKCERESERERERTGDSVSLS